MLSIISECPNAKTIYDLLMYVIFRPINPASMKVDAEWSDIEKERDREKCALCFLAPSLPPSLGPQPQRTEQDGRTDGQGNIV